MDIESSPAWIVLLLIGGIMVSGCEGKGTPPDVPAGTFTARVDGALSDTLTGSAHYRTNDGALTRLELGSETGPGLSIELEPRSPALRTYETIDAELFGLDRPETPPGVMAFLTLDGAQFEATDGTLELTYMNEGRVGATFTFQMEETADAVVGEPMSVEVTGDLNAPVER